jgi:CHAT domain-containing protein
VYPVLLDDRTELIVSLPDGLTSIQVAVGREQITTEIRSFREYVQKRTTRQYRVNASRLYDWLIRPLEELMTGQAIETIVFVPGGALRTIPMAALWDREAKKFLIEKFPLAVVPGLELTSPRTIDREHTQALVAGLTEAVQGYPALQNVSLESQAVLEAFEGRSLMNEEFVAGALEAAVAEKPFGIVHVASHGEFRANADESFLLTYDGRIAMHELAGLVGVTRYHQEPLELLALSACETAVGDDRAALGLAGVAVRAGARSAMATLWSVNDQVAAELVAEFYRQLVQPGMSRARALQQAQIKYLKTRRYRHPSYWAPFLMISNWM